MKNKYGGLEQVNAMNSILRNAVVKALPICAFNINERIYIGRPAELRYKLNQFKIDGLESCQIVSDYDKTLSKQKYNQKFYDTSYGIFKKTNFLSLGLKQNLSLLYSQQFIYHEYRMSFMSNQEVEVFSNSHMNSLRKMWFMKFFNLIEKERINIDTLQRMVTNCRCIFRHGMINMMSFVSQYNIPLQILSGGFSDIILCQMNSASQKYLNKTLGNNVQILSHSLYMDKNKFIKFKDIYVNKVEIMTKLETLKNVIILGDNMEDNSMDMNPYAKNVISICFVDDNFYERSLLKIENDIQYYQMLQKKYDIVIKDDGSVNIVLLLFMIITDGKFNMLRYLDGDQLKYYSTIYEFIKNGGDETFQYQLNQDNSRDIYSYDPTNPFSQIQQTVQSKIVNSNGNSFKISDESQDNDEIQNSSNDEVDDKYEEEEDQDQDQEEEENDDEIKVLNKQIQQQVDKWIFNNVQKWIDNNDIKVTRIQDIDQQKDYFIQNHIKRNTQTGLQKEKQRYDAIKEYLDQQ